MRFCVFGTVRSILSNSSPVSLTFQFAPSKGDYGPDGVAWKAAYRPYLSFKLSDLWAGI